MVLTQETGNKLFLFLFASYFSVSYADLYSSIYGLEALVKTETLLVSSLNDYVEKEWRQLNILEGAHQRAKNTSSILSKKFDSNYIDRFLKHKRQFDAFRLLEKTTVKTKNLTENVLTVFDTAFLPEKSDLAGAASALLRLQDTYALSVKALVKTLKFKEAWLIATESMKGPRPQHPQAILWFQHLEKIILTSIKRHGPRDYLTNYLATIYEYLTVSANALFNYEWGFWYLRKLEKIRTTYDVSKWVSHFEMALKHRNSTWDRSEENLPAINLEPLELYPEFKLLCRGLIPKKELSQRSELGCYLKRNTEFLKLAPIKVEQLNEDPDVFKFIDVVSDAEIETLINLAAPQLKRAKVKNFQRKRNSSENSFESEEIVSSARIAKHAWIPDHIDDVVARITRRVSDMTDLNMEFAEQLQIANYGLGGHYSLHYDMMSTNYTDLNNLLPGNNLTYFDNGNRIGTVLFYLSQPQAGGATVFNEINLAAFPTKNDAIFWHNLYKNGNSDFMTMHGACPVLYGQKWVANKWLHERGNEFTRPCSLNKEE